MNKTPHPLTGWSVEIKRDVLLVTAPNGDEYDLTDDENATGQDPEKLVAMLLAREPDRRTRRLTYGA